MTHQLYLLTPPRVDETFIPLLGEVLATGCVGALQIRLKENSEAEINHLVPQIVKACRTHDVSVIMNDRPDLALHFKTDGVHIGQEDASYKDARALLGPKAIIGVTCHNSRHLAMIAGEQGADYVAFGAFFPTATKTPKASAELDILTWWSELFEVPCVAIGGINLDNAQPVLEAGADLIAVCGSVWEHPDGPVGAVKAFGALLAAS